MDATQRPQSVTEFLELLRGTSSLQPATVPSASPQRGVARPSAPTEMAPAAPGSERPSAADLMRPRFIMTGSLPAPERSTAAIRGARGRVPGRRKSANSGWWWSR